jgi:16S rRNA (guanine1207-N2)-methyltransferase
MICMDADARAVAACKANLEERHAGRGIDCQWIDLSVPQKFSNVDTVIMNPPFHDEKKQAIALGQSFIANAAAMLKPGGRLLMVANAHLPYEDILAKHFKAVEKLHEGRGFKIFHAKR